MYTIFQYISSLFDSDKPYALSTRNRKCADKMHHIWAKRTELGSKNSNKIYVKVMQKALKQPLQHVNFRNFFGGRMPPDRLELFLFLNHLQICSAEKKYAGNKVEIMAHPF